MDGKVVGLATGGSSVYTSSSSFNNNPSNNNNNTKPVAMSFLLGTVLVILVILIATAIVLCFYHWAQLIKDAISSSHSPPPSLLPSLPPFPHAILLSIHQSVPSSTADLPVVYMPGNEMPTFIAFPCPYSIDCPGVKLKEAPTTSLAMAELKLDIRTQPTCETANSNDPN